MSRDGHSLQRMSRRFKSTARSIINVWSRIAERFACFGPGFPRKLDSQPTHFGDDDSTAVERSKLKMIDRLVETRMLSSSSSSSSYHIW